MSSKLQITPAECRLRAAECHKMGQNARRPHVRDTLARLAYVNNWPLKPVSSLCSPASSKTRFRT